MNPNVTAEFPEIWTSNGTVMPNLIGRNRTELFNRAQVQAMAIQTSAITLMIVNVFVWSVISINNGSAFSKLMTAMLVTYFVGLISQSVVKFTGTDSDFLLVFVGMTCYVLSSIFFMWVYFIRFQIITPLKRSYQKLAGLLIGLQSFVAIVIMSFWWNSALHHKDGMRRRCAHAYSILALFEALTCVFFSGHFIYTFYVPLYSKASAREFCQIYLGGLCYLILENLVHFCSTVLFIINALLSHEVTVLCVSVRYSLLLIFFINLQQYPIGVIEGDASAMHPPFVGIDDHIHDQLVSHPRKPTVTSKKTVQDYINDNYGTPSETESEQYEIFHRPDHHAVPFAHHEQHEYAPIIQHPQSTINNVRHSPIRDISPPSPRHDRQITPASSIHHFSTTSTPEKRSHPSKSPRETISRMTNLNSEATKKTIILDTQTLERNTTLMRRDPAGSTVNSNINDLLINADLPGGSGHRNIGPVYECQNLSRRETEGSKHIKREVYYPMGPDGPEIVVHNPLDSEATSDLQQSSLAHENEHLVQFRSAPNSIYEYNEEELSYSYSSSCPECALGNYHHEDPATGVNPVNSNGH